MALRFELRKDLDLQIDKENIHFIYSHNNVVERNEVFNIKENLGLIQKAIEKIKYPYIGIPLNKNNTVQYIDNSTRYFLAQTTIGSRFVYNIYYCLTNHTFMITWLRDNKARFYDYRHLYYEEMENIFINLMEIETKIKLLQEELINSFESLQSVGEKIE